MSVGNLYSNFIHLFPCSCSLVHRAASLHERQEPATFYPWNCCERCIFLSTENCVDFWKKEDPDRVALIWEKDEPGDVEHITYALVSFASLAQSYVRCETEFKLL